MQKCIQAEVPLCFSCVTRELRREWDWDQSSAKVREQGHLKLQCETSMYKTASHCKYEAIPTTPIPIPAVWEAPIQPWLEKVYPAHP